MLKYEVLDEDIHKLYESEPTNKEVGEAFDTISNKLRSAKKLKLLDEKYLLFFLFATHGVLMEGKQHIFLNEFKKDESYYRRVAVE